MKGIIVAANNYNVTLPLCVVLTASVCFVSGAGPCMYVSALHWKISTFKCV